MRFTSTKIHCKHCSALLATLDTDGLCIRRGNIQANITGGDFAVSLTCYRCRTLQVVSPNRERASTTERSAAA